MDLDGRQINGGQGIAYRDAGVSIGRWINDNALVASLRFLNPGHQFSFKIRLANNKLSPKFTTQLYQRCIDRIKGHRPINGFFSMTQQVQIWSVKDQDAQHVCDTSLYTCLHHHGKGGILAVRSQRVKPLKSWGSS